MFNYFNRKPYKIGLALSGGGARGFAHVGAIAALTEFGIKPDIVAGVSAGSVVAAFYAAGLTTDAMMQAFSGASFSELCSLGVPKDGFFSMDGFKKLLTKNIPYKRLEDLPLKTVICATDMEQARKVAFEEGVLADCVAASCSIPIIFKPQVIDGVRYVDGGLLANLPAWAIRERCKYLIGLNCSSMPRRKYKNSLIDIAQASYNITLKTNSRADMALCDLAIEMPEIANYKVFNLKEITKVFKQGYKITQQILLDNGFKPVATMKATTPKS